MATTPRNARVMASPQAPRVRARAPAVSALAPAFRGRGRLTRRQAAALAELFEVLASDTRLRLLHTLVRAGERCVSDLAGDVGVSVQAASNQLAHLTALGIVATRREGTHIRYRIVDPCVPTLLDRGLCIAEEAGRCGL